MANIALLFSGQGAQFPGMGRELYDCSPAARAVFEMADRVRPGTSAQCFTGSKEELSQTINTQPCIFAADLAAARAVAQAGITPCCVAGFSLGEIPALAFAGLMDDETAFRLVCKRGEWMDEAACAHPGAMAAALKLTAAQVEALCEKRQNAWPVNYNSPAQTVVACAADGFDELAADIKAAGGRAVRLAVSGAFHSPFMASAAERLRQYLSNLPLQAPSIPVYSNRTARPYEGDYAALIAEQVQSPVRWQAIIEAMAAQGVDTFIEVGVGKTLTGLVQKIVPSLRAIAVDTKEALDSLAALQ